MVALLPSENAKSCQSMPTAKNFAIKEMLGIC